MRTCQIIARWVLLIWGGALNLPLPSRLPASVVARLPRKRMAAGVLFRDAADRVLLVETSYKRHWEVPGGVVEADESPWAAASREMAEELGWERPSGRLLVVDYIPTCDGRPEGVVYLFDGGVLDDADLAGVRFTDGEIVAARFCTLDEARERVSDTMIGRLRTGIVAAKQGSVILCERGVPVG